MSTPGLGSVAGSTIIYGNVNFGPTLGNVYRPVTNIRVVTAAGGITVLPYDQMIVVKKTVGEATGVTLPAVSDWMLNPYGGFPLTIKDGKYDASTNPITITPHGTDTIDGLSSFQIGGDGASLILVPLTDFSGWSAL